MTYQNLNFLAILALVTIFSLVGLLGKTKSSLPSILLLLLKIGVGLTLLGLGVAWLASDAPVYDLATFKEYHFTLGFIRIYLFGISFLLTIPVLAILKLISRILGNK